MLVVQKQIIQNYEDGFFLWFADTLQKLKYCQSCFFMQLKQIEFNDILASLFLPPTKLNKTLSIICEWHWEKL